MKNVILTVVAVISLVLLSAFIFAYTGVYNVAATGETHAAKAWFLKTTMRNSVASRAKKVEVPDLNNDARLLPGVSHYDAMCVVCHGAPGRTRGEFAAFLSPEPPDFGAQPEALDQWSVAEIFWVTKYGIEMTGMPAWGPTHSDEELWDMVALMKKFPQMSGEQYAALLKRAEEAGHHHDGDDGHHHGDDKGHHHGGDVAHHDGAAHPQQDEDAAQVGGSLAADDAETEPEDNHDHSAHAH